MQSGGTIRIGDQDYAVGLFWQLASAGVRLDKQARAIARQTNADLFVVRPGGTAAPQYGLGSTAEGHKPGLKAAAAGVAAQLTGSAAAVFRVENGYWYVAIRDDAILAEGDTLFHDEDQARERLLRDLDTGDYQTVIAPPEFGVALGDAPPAEDILAALPQTSPQLKLVNPPLKPFLIGGAALAGIAILGGAYVAWTEIQAKIERDLKESTKLPTAKPPILGPIVASTPPALPDKVWENAPLAGSILSACERNLDLIAIPGPNWKLDRLSCNGQGATVTWRSESGAPPSWLLDWGQTAMPQGIRAEAADQNTGAASKPFGSMTARSGQSDPKSLWTGSEIRNTLWRQFLERGIPLQMSRDNGSGPLPIKDPPENKPIPPTTKFSFDTMYAPSVWGATLDAIPGLVITSAEYDLNTNSWKVAGTIYEESDLYEHPRQ